MAHDSRRRHAYIALGLAALALLAVSFAPPDAIQRWSGTRDATTATEHERSSERQKLARRRSGEPVLRGTVRSETGATLPNATVCVTCPACDPTRLAAQPVCTGTDADGAYAFASLRPGYVVVAASAPEHVPSAADGGKPLFIPPHPTSAERADIVLERGGAEVAGVVLDATGGPVAGARVQALVRLDAAPVGPVTPHAIHADGAGHFTIWTRPGTVRLIATADGYAAGHVTRAAPTRNVSILLTPAASVRGVVVDAEGNAVPNVLVIAQGATPEPPQAFSDAAGAFQIDDLAPGGYRLRATGERWIGQSTKTLTIDLGETIEDIVLTVQTAATVRGKLMSDDDQTCPQGMVHLGPQANDHSVPSLVAVADARGDVVFEAVPAGIYQVSVHCLRYEPQPTEPLQVYDRDLDGLVWRMRRQRLISGRVVDRSGKPVERLVLGLLDAQGQPVDRPPVQTDSEGAFNFRAIAPGTYSIDASQLSAPVRVAVSAHADVTGLSLLADAVGRIRVRVVDGAGQPVDGLAVYAAADENLPSLSGQQRGDGAYSLEPLRVGRYTVFVDDSINPRQRASGDGTGVEVRAGETTQLQVTFNAQHGRVTGRVVDELGGPLANVWVHAQATDTGALSAQRVQSLLHRLNDSRRRLTDDDGRFELEGLAERGTFTIIADRPLGGRAQLESVQPGAHVELVLAGSGAIAGTAVDAEGNPVRQFSIQLFNRKTGQRRSEIIADPAGAFELDDVTPGPIQIAAIDPQENIAMLAHELAPRQRASGLRLLLLPQRRARDETEAPEAR